MCCRLHSTRPCSLLLLLLQLTPGWGSGEGGRENFVLRFRVRVKGLNLVMETEAARVRMCWDGGGWGGGSC